jgi:nucleoside-diphosphate-sugar epimerase
MKTLITGGTGLMGKLFLKRLADFSPGLELNCLVRPTSDRREIDKLNLKVTYHAGDSAMGETWDRVIAEETFDTIVHLVQLRQVPTLLASLKKAQQTPRLIIIGTTGVYSKYQQYSSEYQEAENDLVKYPGVYCLLRPTMIYGSPQDKNIHKLIKFCHKYGFFPIFGLGENLVQPIHADDIAQTLLKVWHSPHIQGAYNLSGATAISFRDLLALVEELLGTSVRQVSFSLNLGIWLATLSEKILGTKSPVRREQILRLQEDKAYPHDAAQRDLDFSPRTLKVGLQQEIELMRQQQML